MVLLIAALVGLTIVKVVDHRLGEVSINMPKITLPRIAVYLDREGGVSGRVIQSGGAADTDSICTPSERRDTYDKQRYKSRIVPITNDGITPEPSSDHRERPAPYDVALPTNQVPEIPVADDTHYLSPSDMTPEQLNKFKNKAHFEKMTLGDYENWLWVHRETPAKLTPFHRANLRIILRGGTLTEADRPRVLARPLTAKERYEQLGIPADLPYPQPEFLGYQPSNYEAEVGSRPERSLSHLAFINPDEPLKTWELTHMPPDKEEAPKPSAGELTPHSKINV